VRVNRDNLSTYLNDHLAGSIAALELLEHLAVSTDDDGHEAFVCDLREAIRADQDVLRRLLAELSLPESTTRKVGAWFMEKAGELKLKVDGPTDAGLGRLEALEGLLLGITGKRALWLALGASIEPIPGFDFPALARRAEEQIAAVDERRIRTAKSAFSG
jgi:hypothetical protein